MANTRNKGKKVYRTMRGKTIDMDILAKRNELTPAVGNARVNARGDELGPGGKIIKKREDVIKEYYEQAGSAKPSSGTVAEEIAEELSVDAAATDAEFEAEWVEDEDGNFVAKGD